jgi:hypothetical protein
MKSTPPPAHRTGPFRPTLALQMPKADVPASPWMWAKAAHKLGAVIRLCGDRVVSKEARMGCVCIMKSTPPPAHRTGPFRPTLALQMPKADVPASPWMWAKAAHKLGAVIRLCGDRGSVEWGENGGVICI